MKTHPARLLRVSARNHLRRQAGSRLAFTRLELVVTVIAVALLATAVLPLVAGNQPAAQRLACWNNLRRIGTAFRTWATDHGDENPCRVLQANGGTMPDATGLKAGNAWYEFAWISNELATPRILVCPADTQTRRVARDFSNAAEGGFVNASYRGNALSYFVGTDALFNNPQSWLAGDRDVKVNQINSGCSARVSAAAILSFRFPTVAWLNEVHPHAGNLLLNDGRVRQLTTAGLRQAVSSFDDNGQFHVLLPR